MVQAPALSLSLELSNTFPEWEQHCVKKNSLEKSFKSFKGLLAFFSSAKQRRLRNRHIFSKFFEIPLFIFISSFRAKSHFEI
jgi:hypothetical protein